VERYDTVEASISTHRRSDGAAVVVVRGDLDASGASGLRAAISAALSNWRPPALTIDLGLVTFIDSAGYGALVAAYKAARAVGAKFAVGNAVTTVRRRMDLMGLAEMFGVARPAGDPGSAWNRTDPDAGRSQQPGTR